MNPLSWVRENLILLGVVLVLIAAPIAYHVHAVSSAHRAGVREEAERRDAIDARNTALANAALQAANERVREQQAALAVMQSDLERLSQENQHAKLEDHQRGADLLAGRDRMRVNVQPTASDPAQAGPACGAAAAAVDPGASAQYDLAPAVAAGLDAIREQHNEAVRRLDACVMAYDKVKAAVNALP